MEKSGLETGRGEYLAKPSGVCCLKGTIHEGEAQGTWDVIEGVETYIATPPNDKANGHILLYFPDVWGLFLNGLLVMDAFADAGYLTLGLDYFRGVSMIESRYLYAFQFHFGLSSTGLDRTLCGSIERTDMTKRQILALTTKRGKRSTLNLQMRQYRDGLLP